MKQITSLLMMLVMFFSPVFGVVRGVRSGIKLNKKIEKKQIGNDVLVLGMDSVAVKQGEEKALEIRVESGKLKKRVGIKIKVGQGIEVGEVSKIGKSKLVTTLKVATDALLGHRKVEVQVGEELIVVKGTLEVVAREMNLEARTIVEVLAGREGEEGKEDGFEGRFGEIRDLEVVGEKIYVLEKERIRVVEGKIIETLVEGMEDGKDLAVGRDVYVIDGGKLKVIRGGKLEVVREDLSNLEIIAMGVGEEIYVAGSEEIKRINEKGEIEKVGDVKDVKKIEVNRNTGEIYAVSGYKLVKVGLKGEVEEIAGGEEGYKDGLDGRFGEICGIKVLGETILIADKGNGLLREVSHKEVRTIVGGFKGLRGIDVAENGRIVIGEGERYVLKGIRRPPEINELSPGKIKVGEELVIKGKRFDSRGIMFNRVSFSQRDGEVNGNVRNVSKEEIRVEIPIGAETGKVRVETAMGIGESPSVLEVEQEKGPQVDSLNPQYGVEGTVVVIHGSGLQVGIEKPEVKFGGGVVGEVVNANEREINVVVPRGAKKGPIEVRNAFGFGRSREEFDVREGGYEIVVAPSSVEVEEDGTGKVMVYVGKKDEKFKGLIRLEIEGVPDGVKTELSRKWVTSGASSEVELDLKGSGIRGGMSYEIIVVGNGMVGGGEVRKEARVKLFVRYGGETRLKGRVLSTLDEPLPGVVVSLDGKSAVTDAAGMYVLEGIQAGKGRVVMVDGRRANVPNAIYPVIVEPADVEEGKLNTIPEPFYLPRIEIENEVTVVPGRKTEVTTPKVPGLKLEIPEGAHLVQRDGIPVLSVTLTKVPIDRTPAPLPANAELAMVFSAQPGGADSSEPMPVTYPNTTGAAPGSRSELWNYNHDEARWEIYGYGVVSKDGKLIEPEVNPKTGKRYGLAYFSWFGPRFRAASDTGGPGPGSGGPGGGKDGGDCPSCSGENPVNFATGYKVQEDMDIEWGGIRGGLRLERVHLNVRRMGRFGLGWSDNWDMEAFYSNVNEEIVMIKEWRKGDWWMYWLDRVEGEGENRKQIYVNKIEPAVMGDEVIVKKGNGIEYRKKGGEVIVFTEQGRLEKIVDRNGNETRMIYGQERLRLEGVQDGVGRRLEFKYRNDGLVEVVMDEMGREWRYEYGEDGGSFIERQELKWVIDPMGNKRGYEYEQVVNAGTGERKDIGRLVKVIDKKGQIEKEIEYENGDENRSGRVVRQVLGEGKEEKYRYEINGGRVTSVYITDALGRVTMKRFNERGYVIGDRDGKGMMRQYSRNGENSLPETVIGVGGELEVRREYDSRGNVVKIVDAKGQETRMEYENKYNQLTKVVDKKGRETRYEYDDKGNKTKVINTKGEETNYSYDEKGQLIRVVDAMGGETKYEYDAYGNMTSRIDELGNRTTYEYNKIGWLMSTTDQLGRRSEMKYDQLGRVIERKGVDGQVTKYNYDENGNQVSVTNAIGQKMEMKYDGRNRLVSRIDPKGRESRYEYNVVDELVKVVSPSGKETSYKYDERGQVVEMKAGDGSSVRYEYDAEGKLVALIDQRGNVTIFSYDELGRQVKTTDAKGKETKVEYDEEGNVIAVVDRMGRKTMLLYDELNRVMKIMYPDATIEYMYDRLGRRTNVKEGDKEIEWKYDEVSRIVEEATKVGAVKYSYNEVGERIKTEVPNQEAVEYKYDGAGRLEKIVQGSEVYGYNYDELSRLTKLSRPNEVTTSYEYDEVSRVKQIKHINKAGEAVENLEYEYSVDDEILKKKSLNSETLQGQSKTLSEADSTNRIEQAGGAKYEFNEVGEPITKVDLSGTTKYEWDARGRLTKITLPNGQEVSYTYDALNRKTSRTANKITEEYMYEGQDIVQDRIGTTTVNYLNGLGIDNKLSQTSKDTMYFLQDHLGSTIALADKEGTIKERIQYEAFGANTGSTYTRYTYTGREEDPLTGLIYYRARWYDPQQGRFLTEDSSEIELDENFYVYVKNNPVNLIDPLGLEWTKPGIGDLRRLDDWEIMDRPIRLKPNPRGANPPSPVILEFLRCLQACLFSVPGSIPIIVTSTTDGVHSDPGHKGGTAVDIRYNDNGTQAKARFCCGARCGAKYALDEGKVKTKYGTGVHYHFQLNERADKKRGALPELPCCTE